MEEITFLLRKALEPIAGNFIENLIHLGVLVFFELGTRSQLGLMPLRNHLRAKALDLLASPEKPWITHQEKSEDGTAQVTSLPALITNNPKQTDMQVSKANRSDRECEQSERKLTHREFHWRDKKPYPKLRRNERDTNQDAMKGPKKKIPMEFANTCPVLPWRNWKVTNSQIFPSKTAA